MVGQPGAHEAIGKEKSGLLEASAWLEDGIVSKAEALAWASRTSNVIHIGSLMVTLSVTGACLDLDLWKLKARIIVFRGDSVRDNHGESATLKELCAHHLLPLKASIQLSHLGFFKATDVSPPMLFGLTFKQLSSPRTRPVCCCHLSLFLKPRSTSSPRLLRCTRLGTDIQRVAHWAKHLRAILLGLGGREFEGMPSVYYFEREGLILCVYLDDLTLAAGRIEVHPAFWNKLSQR